MTEEEKPLTREEVLKMIEEHGGPEGLDLCGRNLEGINLSSETKNEEFLHLPSIIISKGVKPLDLHGIVVIGANLQQAELSGANLQGANLFKAKLQGAFLIDANLRRAYLSSAELQGALLWHADLEGATLEYAELQGTELKEANLKGANLEYATLRGAYLEGFTIDSNTKLQNVDWGHDYMVREEKERWFQAAQGIYRILKQWHTQAGIYDIAGEFYFREMTVKRKALRWWPNPLPRAWSKFLAVLCGYGEKPWRVVASAGVVVFGLAGIYSSSALSFPSSLYHSAVSFTALGYGLGVSTADGWVKAVGAFEAFMGVFMMALFLITFVRKMTR